MTTTINKLKMAAQYQLMQYVEQHFAAAKQSDEAFAQTASQALGFKVTTGNIYHARTSLSIPSYLAEQRNCVKRSLQEQIEGLEARLSKLEKGLLG